MPDMTMVSPFLLLAAAGVLLAAAAYLLWRGRRAGRDADRNAFRVLGIDASSALELAAPPPVDLSRPIAGDAHWRAIRAHAGDAVYQRAVETVRLRYQVVSNPVLLSNTLRETMARSGLSFREAMIRVAENDGLR